MKGDVRAQDLWVQHCRQRVVSLLPNSFLSFIGIILPAWPGFPLGKGYITGSAGVSSVIHLLEGLSARSHVTNLCQYFLHLHPASCSQTLILFSPWLFFIRFWADLWCGAIYSKILGVSIRTKVPNFSWVVLHVIPYFPSRKAADIHW